MFSSATSMANWTQVAKLLADDGDYGDNFGYTVAVDGDVIAVGVPDDEDLGNWSGSAYVFERDQSGSWSQVGKLLASDGGPLESFGASVAVSGNLILVGTPNA
ncbi:MAG TPA: FG-GAP repeat protein [Phycisphaerae bacterium]|nr:FG-GAP repeat protein [Phycisphaerae bacterium]